MQMDVPDLESQLARWHEAAFAWAMACCRRDWAEAQDALQTAYLLLLEGRARFRGQSSFKTFLFGVIRQTASSARRRGLLRRLLLRRAHEPTPASADPPDPDSHKLLEAVDALPSRQREIIELVFAHGLTLDEAAEVMAVSSGTARQHYQRAKEALRARLGGDDEPR